MKAFIGGFLGLSVKRGKRVQFFFSSIFLSKGMDG